MEEHKEDIIAFLFIIALIVIIEKLRRKLLNHAYNKMMGIKPKSKEWSDASKALKVKEKKLKKMKKGEVKSIYRKRAQETHPDHGGNPDEFRKVQEAYEFVYDQAA